MQAYFRALKADQVAKDNQRFGWTSKNEILNGRHVMGGIFVGLLTEYSTGVNFIDQLKDCRHLRLEEVKKVERD